MKCIEHDFIPWPGSQNRLYCRHCTTGAVVAFDKAAEGAKPRRRPARRPEQEAFDFHQGIDPGVQAEADLARQMRAQGFADEAEVMEELDEFASSVQDVIERRIPVDEGDDAIGRGTGL